MPAFTDVYIKVVNGALFASPGTWIQIRNNATGAAFTSTSAADGSSVVNFGTSLPEGSYTVYTGPANTGPWTITTETAYLVPNAGQADKAFPMVGPGPWIDITHPTFGGKGNGILGTEAAAFNAAVTALPATGGTIIVPPTTANTYIAEATFAVNKPNVTVQLLGMVMIQAKAGLNTDVFKVTASNVFVVGGIIDGNTASNTSGRGLVVDAPGAAQFVTGFYALRVAIQNCTGVGGTVVCTGAGSSVTAAVWQGCNVTVSSTGFTATVRPGGGTVDMTTFRDCIINTTVQHGINSSGANRTNISGCSFLLVGLNKVSGFSHAIAVDGNAGNNPCSRIRAVQNWILNPYDAGIEYADSITGGHIAYNTIIAAGSGAAPANTYGIFFGGGFTLSTDCVIIGNTCINCKGNGFMCSGPDATHFTANVRFLGNTATGNGNDGIFVQNTDTYSVIGNTCQNNSVTTPNSNSGIDLANAIGGKVIANDCQGKGANQSRGINERTTSDQNLICLNDVRGNVTAPFILQVGPNTRVFANLGYLVDQRTAQSLAFAATITPDASLGEFIAIGALTANLTLHIPTNVQKNTFITYLFIQDATGGRTITWDAGQRTSWQPAASPSAVSTVSFFFDGTLWWMLNGVAVDNFGTVYAPTLKWQGGNMVIQTTAGDIVTNPSGALRPFTDGLHDLGQAGFRYAQLWLQKRVAKGIATPAYSASITPDASAADWQAITVTNNTAFTINAPTNPPSGIMSQELTIEIFNNSGGAMGVITFNAAFILVGGAFTNPANTKHRNIRFQWNGANWIEIVRASADY